MAIEGVDIDGQARSLDDVIALRSDGKFEFAQVKFTKDSSRDDLSLSFEWLTKKKKKGTSLLEKWSGDVLEWLKEGALGHACLRTNRKPDSEFGACLEGGRIVFDKIPSEIRSNLLGAFNREADAMEFFEAFEFLHSQAEVDALHDELYNELVPDHTTEVGWLRLLKSVEKWATTKGVPNANGTIALEDLKEVLESSISKPISQAFDVPEGYAVPSEKFHEHVVEKIGIDGAWVIFGKPGVGKSTYLSYLVDHIKGERGFVVRHHYSIGSHDVVDRVAFNNAAHSIMSQLQSEFLDEFGEQEIKVENLDHWVRRAIEIATRQGRRLTIIVDGLDHVSRKRSNIGQLEHLVNRILPFMDRCCLLFGTQPIGDSHLPSSLLSQIPKDSNWLQIPNMDLRSVKALAERELRLAAIGDAYRLDEVAELSESLLRVSAGYPLHLRYCLKMLGGKASHITTYDVEGIPVFSGDDINEYYGALWTRLSVSAKRILSLIAVVDFPWPDVSSLSYCFSDQIRFREAFEEIVHLVEQRKGGVYPFHGSLLVYLNSLATLKEERSCLLKDVSAWLAEGAPEFWRWGWEWIVTADLGEFSDLVEGVDLEWLVRSFAKGYPREHIGHIVSKAEDFASDNGMYPELVRLRLLGTRLRNGPEFQLHEYDRFLHCAIALNGVSAGVEWMADHLSSIDDESLGLVASFYSNTDQAIVEQCYEEALGRLKFYVRLDYAETGQRIEKLIQVVFEILLDCENHGFDRVIEFYCRVNDDGRFFRQLVERMFVVGKEQLLLSIPEDVIPDSGLIYYRKKLPLVCAAEGVDFTTEKYLSHLRESWIGKTLLMLSGVEPQGGIDAKPQLPEQHRDLSEELLVTAFFYGICAGLSEGGKVESAPAIQVVDAQTFSGVAMELMEWLGSNAGASVAKDGHFDVLRLFEFCDQANLPEMGTIGFDAVEVRRKLIGALDRSSADFLALLQGLGKATDFDSVLLEGINDSQWWRFERWFSALSNRLIESYCPIEVSFRLLGEAVDLLAKSRDNTGDLVLEGLDLVEIACKLGHLEKGKEALLLVSRNTLGYGHRKDIRLNDLYDAIETCSKYGVGEVRDWLKRVSVFTKDVFEFSEREIQHIPKWYLRLLADHHPSQLAQEFAYALEDHSWRYAHDVLEICVRNLSLDSEAEFALIRCLSFFEARKALDERVSDDSRLSDLQQEVGVLWGLETLAPRAGPASTEFEEKEVSIAYTDFPPGRIVDLDQELEAQSIFSADTYLGEWVRYWAEAGEGAALLQSMDSVCESQGELPRRFHRVLPEVYDIAKQLFGKTESLKWAVRDVLANNYWGAWGGREDSSRALLKYAKIYKDSWKEFYLATTEPGIRQGRSGTRTVPMEKFVLFLLECAEVELATEITESMVSSLEMEIAHLPLSDSMWKEEVLSHEEIALNILLSLLFWPDRLVRLRVAAEIGMLLEQDGRAREMFLERLALSRNEVETIEFLFVLPSTVIDLAELRDRIKHPSFVSENVLGGIYGEDVVDTSQYGGFLEYLGGQRSISSGFEKSKNGIPPYYYNVIEGLDAEGLFLAHMSAEWDELEKRSKSSYLDAYNFCGDHFYRMDRISCSFSSNTEGMVVSAYLRTLACAKSLGMISTENFEFLALKAMPSGSGVGQLRPRRAPCGWPVVNLMQKEDPLPDHDTVVAWLNGLKGHEEVVLRSDGPVLRDTQGVSLDFEVLLVNSKAGCEFEMEECFRLVDEGIDCTSEWRVVGDAVSPFLAGRWEIDFAQRGHFQPTYVASDGTGVSAIFNEDRIQYMGGSVLNAEWSYWVHNWYPARHSGLGSSIGTSLVCARELFESMTDAMNGDFYLLGRLSYVDKRGHSTRDNKVQIVCAGVDFTG
ncbi:hypothetical protein VDG1235_797 [Verrucomicrobiia bacterium DG1235]|nr:hypothetical protein VDG1235_797 [Verrucomicrobiae bacterium DG1235]